MFLKSVDTISIKKKVPLLNVGNKVCFMNALGFTNSAGDYYFYCFISRVLMFTWDYV